MNASKKRLVLAAIAACGTVAAGLAAFSRPASASYFPGVICMMADRTSSYSSQGEILENASSTTSYGVQCPTPVDFTMNDIVFAFSIGVKGTGTTTCTGRAYDRNQNLAWQSQATSHSGASGYVDKTANTGPAGTSDYNYNATCTLAPGHLIRRIRLD